MKRIVIISSFALAMAALLVHAKVGKNTIYNNNNVAQASKKMTRTKMASGLEYEILEEGTGASPQKGNLVTVHYTGWLNDNGQAGKQFDSSHNRHQPFQFYIGMGQVIKGWDEGVMGMKIGEKRRLYIPAALGYGARGAGAVIPGNADLIFDVELIKVD
jgi:FKBP-type peptidyl-prolyl cis-trans isomerase FkpA